jgi:hypothetical protein
MIRKDLRLARIFAPAFFVLGESGREDNGVDLERA